MHGSAPAAAIPRKTNPGAGHAINADGKIFPGRFSAISAERNIKIQIEYQCPQCGAPAVLQETDRLFQCNYCRVSSYLFAGDVFRYVLPIHPSVNREMIHVPYWRFKGVMYACVSHEIKNHFMDLSLLALKSDFFPNSLGLRSQTLKLKFVSPDTRGSFLDPTLPAKNAVNHFQSRFDQESSEPVFHREYMGESLSLIYSPVFMNRTLYDAVLDQPITIAHPGEQALQDLPRENMNWKLDFLATLCPDCGWNLTGEKNALVLACRNCNTLWMPVNKTFKKLPFAFDVSKDEEYVYFPFWAVKAEIAGLQLRTVADMAKAANLPKIVREEWNHQDFQFRVPAFRLRPGTFLRVSTAATLSQMGAHPEKKLPGHQPAQAVNLSIKEALKSLKLILADFFKPREKIFPLLNGITLAPKSFSLIFLGFKDIGHEYFHPDYNLAITKNHIVSGD
jgi:ribosomal protein L37AE/L43A